MKKISKLAGLLPVVFLALLAGCAQEKEVGFSGDVRPILENNCMTCHKKGGQGELASGFDMTTYDSFMKGTKFGPVVDPGSSISSTLVRIISGKTDKSIQMPHGEGNKKLTETDIATITNWVDQGAKNN